MADAAPGSPPDDRRMSEAEGLMWRLEADPMFASAFASVTVLDRPADVERVRHRLARAVVLVPRLRQRVQERPFGLPPIWVDVPEVDLDHHLRVMTLPSPGTDAQLNQLAADLLAEPLDPQRPLWQFVLVDGLEGGRGALLQKMHHTITDGENGLRLSMQFLDLERDAPDPPPPTEAELAAAQPQPPPSPADAAREALAMGARLGAGVLRELSSVALDPTRLAEVAAGIGERLRGTVATLADTEPAHSTLWATRSLQRRLETLQVPLEPVKAAAHAFGGTLNVAFLTATAAASGRYHAELGAPVDSLRASMAISTRTATEGANAFTLARLRVPTTEMSPAERFAAIQAEAELARQAATSTSATLSSVAGLAIALPTPVLLHLARQQIHTVDFATSNLRGAPFPVYLAGSRLLATYPLGPLLGVAFNLTLLSYCGSLDMGLHLDPAAVTEPGRLRALLLDAFDELIEAGEAAATPHRRGKDGHEGGKKKARKKQDGQAATKAAKTTKAAKAAKTTKTSKSAKSAKVSKSAKATRTATSKRSA